MRTPDNPQFRFAQKGTDITSDVQARKAMLDYRLCSEVGQIVRMSSNILSSCFFEVAIDGKVPKKKPSFGSADGKLHAFATQSIERRFGADPDGQGLKIAALSEIRDLTGDACLIGYHVDSQGNPTAPRKKGTTEIWEIYANHVVKSLDDGLGYELAAAIGLNVTVPTAVIDRLYRPDPEHRLRATSWVIQAHGICVDLALFRMARRSAGRSQIMADMLLIPSEATPEDPTTVGEWGDGVGTGSEDEFAENVEEMIHDALVDAMNDAADGRQVLPLVMAVESEFIEHFQTLALSRQLDVEHRPTIQGLREELAESADMPPESLFGLGKTNRWNGRQVTEEEFRRYLSPKTREYAADLTRAILWRDMAAKGIPPEMYRRFTVKINNENAVVKPDWATVAPTLVKDGAIGPSAERRLLGLDDSYAPTAEEKAERAASRPGGGQNGPTSTGMEPPNKGQGTGRQRDDTVNPDNQGPAGQINRVAGSGAPTPLEMAPAPDPALAQALRATTLGLADEFRSWASGVRSDLAAADDEPAADRIAALLAVEQETWARLEEACEAAWDAGLSRAGAQLKNWARSPKVTLPEVETRLLADLVGHERCAELAGRKFDSAEDRDPSVFGPALAALLAAWARIMDMAWDRSGLDIPQAERERAKETSLAVLRDSMVAALAVKVFQGWTAPQGGEALIGRVPLPVLRRAMAAAGGHPGVSAGFEPNPDLAAGMMFGPLVLGAAGLAVVGWEWLHRYIGPNPFELHNELHGQVFTSLSDPALDGGPFGRKYPGDHFGCRCLMFPRVRPVGP